ncbi:MAG: hypothetical protein AB7G07_16575 [Bauldia sp.]
MRQWLEQLGFSVHRADGIADSSRELRASAGAIISLAVSSSVSGSPTEIFETVRREAPAIPVLFTGLMPFATAASIVTRVASATRLEVNVFDAAHLEEASYAVLGRPDTLLYLSKRDLDDAGGRRNCSAALKRHFR